MGELKLIILLLRQVDLDFLVPELLLLDHAHVLGVNSLDVGDVEQIGEEFDVLVVLPFVSGVPLELRLAAYLLL